MQRPFSITRPKSVWESKNPKLLVHQPGFEAETGKVKIGDGTKRWNSLPYANEGFPYILPEEPNTLFGSASVVAAEPSRSQIALTQMGVLRGVPVSDESISTADFTARTTSGTHRSPHHINVASTDLTFVWINWRNNATNASPNYADADGAAACVIRSSAEIRGQIYRLTYNGRTDGTVDPGGFLQSDPLPVSVSAGEVIYVRTFVISGSWHYTHYSLVAGGAGGVVATTDLTAPGSAAVPDSAFGAMFAPAVIVGRPVSKVPAVLVVGTSIAAGGNDHPSTTSWQGRNVTAPQLHGGGFLNRALYGKAGLINAAVPGSTAQSFVADSGNFRRMAFARNCSTMIDEYGRNDISGGRTLAQLQADKITSWRMGVARGLRVIQTTVTPKTNSSDGWRTTSGQTVPSVSQETVRVGFNDWIRDGAPLVSAENLIPAATGTPNALRAGQPGHPLFGYWEIADKVETARNSGLWKPWTNTRSVNDAAMAAGGNGLTSATAGFTNADLGRAVFLAGAGASAGDYYSIIQKINSATSANPNLNGTTAVTVGLATIGDSFTLDGTHPSPYGHTQMATGCDLTMLV